MVIPKIHGHHATVLSLHDRFTLISNAASNRVALQQRKRRASVGSLINQNNYYSNRFMARRLEQQTKWQSMKQRLGFQQGNLRRFGSESSLAGLKRSNSFGNLSQQSFKSRVSWRQSNGNLSRSASFNNLANIAWRGFRKRGGQRGRRGQLRAVSQGPPNTRMQQRIDFQQRNGIQQRNGFQRRGVQQRRGMQQRRGAQQRRGVQHRLNVQQTTNGEQNVGPAQYQRPQVARRGARGGARGGMTRSQSQPRLLSKEELDAQLDQYMSCTKAALDQELDNYMKNAMELE